jgi:hypothetical protein
MGFGLLLVGYFTAMIMSINSLGGIFRLLGYLLICKGAKKLSQYNSHFLFLLYVSIPSLILSAFCAVSDVSDFLLLGIFDVSMANTLSLLKVIFDLLTVLTMCIAVHSISKDTGAEKTVYSSVRNLAFYGLYMVIQVLVMSAKYFQSETLLNFIADTALPIWMVIINLVCIILNCLMLFSCYARICDVDDVEMERKPSRFAFINKMRAEKEEKRQKCVKDAEEYLGIQQPKYTPEQQARAELAERAKKKNKHK